MLKIRNRKRFASQYRNFFRNRISPTTKTIRNFVNTINTIRKFVKVRQLVVKWIYNLLLISRKIIRSSMWLNSSDIKQYDCAIFITSPVANHNLMQISCIAGIFVRRDCRLDGSSFHRSNLDFAATFLWW